MKNRVLISTINPESGGVPQMTRFISTTLEENGFEPILAYYKPYKKSPDLSVPLFHLGIKNEIRTKLEYCINNYESHAIGAWFPELEFTHYLPTYNWKKLINSCKYHISVSGNCMPATPYVITQKAFIAWVATPWHEDRKDRTANFILPRKVLDRLINSVFLRKIENKILQQGKILALSNYTRKKLNVIAQKEVVEDVLPMPINTCSFKPSNQNVIHGKLGFTGRFCDERKNITMLFKVLRILRQMGHPIIAEIIGDQITPRLERMVDSLNLSDYISFIPHLHHNKLSEHLSSFDLFVIPSFQEGLCISAIEAMACGCPVVSTRCGGPEEFVIENKTGYLVDFNPESMANAIIKIISNRNLRTKLSEQAVLTVNNFYSIPKAKHIFWNSFNKTFNS